MNKSSKKKVQPEQKLNSEQKADDKQVSPAIGNAHVVCFPVTEGVLLSKDEALEKLKDIPLQDFGITKDTTFRIRNKDGSCSTYKLQNIRQALREGSSLPHD